MEIEKYDKTEKLDKVEKLKKQDSILKENSKNRNIIAKLTGNPSRLAGLKESFKYFSLLKKNVYLERKQFKPSQDDIMVCNCIQCPEDQVQQKQGQASYNCGERCINKYTCTECDVDLCPCGLLCKNRRFQKHEDACVYPFKCGGKGMGLSAGEKILKGQFIMQYIGEIFYIKSALGRRRVQEYSRSTCTYLMKINNLEVIDPTYKGNLARFINHSCEPNCITMKWNVLGEVCIGIFANRDIEEDEELTFDYQFDAFNTPLTKCLCGAKNCKGYLGLKPTNKSQEEWDEHLENMVCGICSEKTPFDDEMLLLCDKCNCGFHMNCLSPPLVQVPKDAWFCSECLEENRLEDEKEKEREKFEGILQQKLKQFKNDRKKKQKQSSSEESSDSSESYNYDQRFKQFKQLETETIITQNERIVNFVHDGKSSQLQQIVELAYKNFIQWFEDNQDLNQKIQLNQLQKLQSDTIKVSFRVNIIEQKLVKKISNIIYMIGNKTSFEQIDQQYEDFFKKENDLTVIGTSQQTEIFSIILLQIESIVKDLKQEMGIIEGQIRIPIIFLRRLISQMQHFYLLFYYFSNQLEKIYEVNIIFNKNLALSEEIFALDKYTPIKIKGAKQNIENCVQNIDQIMENLQIQRLYLSRSETKTVQQNLYNLKNITEIRISRDQNFKFDYYNQRDINHPFYYIQYREKEVCLIGTFEQIQESISYIKELLLSESHTEKEMTYFTILIPPQMKEQCKNMKSQIEKMFAQTKVLLFEPSHPRKNITILVLCLKKQLQTIRQQFHQLILNSCEIQIDKYQDQMMIQMCRYVYKYLQNMIMTEDIAFMKNWDIISPYFSDYKNNMDGEENWFVQKCHLNLQRDAETQLYIQQLMHEEICVEDDENSERKKQIVGLIKRVLTNAQTQIKSLQESDNLFGDDDNQQVLDGLEQLRIFPSSKSQSMSRSNSNSKSNEKSKSKTQSESKSKSKTKSKTKSKSISKSISKSKSRPNEVKKNILYSSSDDQNQQSSDTESDDSSSSEQIRSMFKSFDPHLQDTFKTQQNGQKHNKQDENITSFQYKKQELIIPIIDNNLKSEQNGTSNQKFKITSLQIPQKSDSDDSQNSKSPERRYRQDYRHRETYDKYRDYKSYNRNYNRNYKSRNDVKNERSNYRRNDYEKVYYKRNDSNDQFERSDRNDKYEKYERYDRHDKYDKDQRYDKYEKDRYYKNHKNDKIEKSEKSDKQEKSDKPDRSERNDRYDKYERYRYDDRNKRYNRYDRQNDRQERYEEKSQNRYNRQRNEKYVGSNIKQVDLRSEYKAKPRYRYESHYKNQRSESSQSASSNSLNSKQKNRQNRYYRNDSSSSVSK